MSVTKRSSRKSSPSEFPTYSSDAGPPKRFNAEWSVYGLVAAVLWFVPLLNRLHVESMAVLAFVAYFVAGRAAHAEFRKQDARAETPTKAGFGRVLIGRLPPLLLPLGMLTVSTLWAPNCDYVRGLLFAPLFPGVTVVFAVSLAYALETYGRSFRYLAGIGALVCLAGPLFDIGLHPQFYTYNHVFGGILGPIYDEELAIRPGLFWFRMLTLLWAALAYTAAMRKRGGARSSVRPAVLAVAVGLCYLFSAQLGFNTPSWYLQGSFSGQMVTRHFVLHFDRASATADEVHRWAVEHEYRYARLREKTGLDVPRRIHSYLYPDEEVRARLTGARYTSVAPVWLAEPQVHVLASQVGTVFPHELAHVFSREFGLPVLKASISVGLVEGFAVATEPPDGRPTPHEMVAASDLFRETPADELAGRIAATLTPSGFWTGRGGVSYTTSGSFVEYLIERYGIERFERVYPLADFRSAYGRDAEELALEWVRWLHELPAIDASAAWRAAAVFSVPSLFERSCPHWIPVEVRRVRQAEEHLKEGRLEDAGHLFSGLLKDRPDYVRARIGWGQWATATGREAAVLDTLTARPRSGLTAAERDLLGVAFALTGRPDSARAIFSSEMGLYPQFARDARALIELRARTADIPDLLRIAVSVDSTRADSVSERLSAVNSFLAEREVYTGRRVPEALLWRARIEAGLNAWSAALASLEAAMSEPDGPCAVKIGSDLSDRCPVWAASYAYRSGDIDRALAYAETAARRANQKGDDALVRQLYDFTRKMEWLRTDGIGVPR